MPIGLMEQALCSWGFSLVILKSLLKILLVLTEKKMLQINLKLLSILDRQAAPEM